MSKAMGGLSPSKGWAGYRKGLTKLSVEELTRLRAEEGSGHVQSLIDYELKKKEASN